MSKQFNALPKKNGKERIGQLKIVLGWMGILLSDDEAKEFLAKYDSPSSDADSPSSDADKSRDQRRGKHADAWVDAGSSDKDDYPDYLMSLAAGTRTPKTEEAYQALVRTMPKAWQREPDAALSTQPLSTAERAARALCRFIPAR